MSRHAQGPAVCFGGHAVQRLDGRVSSQGREVGQEAAEDGPWGLSGTEKQL